MRTLRSLTNIVPLGCALQAISDGLYRFAVFNKVAEQLKRYDRRDRESTVDELVVTLAPSGDYRPNEQFLDWDGARELQKYMKVGSRSMYHSILSRETAPAQQADLAESRRQLAQGLYADTIAAAKQAGHTYAVTTEHGWNTRSAARYKIHRWVMRPERGSSNWARFSVTSPYEESRHRPCSASALG